MGEALMPRRGGAVKTGTIANVEAHSIQDDNLIGAKNALIVLMSPAIGMNATSLTPVFSLRVVDGVMKEMNICEGNYYADGLNTQCGAEFNPANGAITLFALPGQNQIWAIFGYSNINLYQYQYVVY